MYKRLHHFSSTLCPCANTHLGPRSSSALQCHLQMNNFLLFIHVRQSFGRRSSAKNSLRLPDTSPAPVLQAEPTHTSGLFLPQNPVFQACSLLTYFSKSANQFFDAQDIFNAAAGVERCWEGFACPPRGALVSRAMETKPTDTPG